MQLIRAKYVYGLTAISNRSDRLDDIIHILLGPVIHRYTLKDQADEQGLLIFAIAIYTRIVNITGQGLDIHETDSLIADSLIRIEQLVFDTVQVSIGGSTPVILTKLKRYVKMLSSQLEGKADHVFLIYCGQSEKQNQKKCFLCRIQYLPN